MSNEISNDRRKAESISTEVEKSRYLDWNHQLFKLVETEMKLKALDNVYAILKTGDVAKARKAADGVLGNLSLVSDNTFEQVLAEVHGSLSRKLVLEHSDFKTSVMMTELPSK